MRVRRDDKALTLEYEQPLSYINNTGNGLEDIPINEIVELFAVNVVVLLNEIQPSDKFRFVM